MNLISNPGENGYDIITDTSAHTGQTWDWIFFVADTVFTTLTDATKLSGAITGLTYKAGCWIPGNFTTITLASGSIHAYRAKA